LITSLEFSKERFYPDDIYSTFTFLLYYNCYSVIPLSRQASSWNRCIKKTSASLIQIKAVKKLNGENKEVLSVMICNGAVFESKIERIIK